MTLYALLGAAVLGGSLGLFGAGGTSLAVPILVYLVAHAEKQAIVEALAIVGLIAAAGCAQNAAQGRVSWPHVLLFGAPGMVGALCGAFIAQYLPGVVQLVAVALLIVVVAALMLRPVRAAPGRGGRWLAGPIGFGVGLLTGALGVGGGFMIVPALVLLCGMEMPRAVGTSLGIIALNALAGFAKSLLVTDVTGAHPHMPTILIFAVVGALGGALGNFVGGRIDQARLRRGFAMFLLCVAAYILLVEGRKLLSAG